MKKANKLLAMILSVAIAVTMLGTMIVSAASSSNIVPNATYGVGLTIETGPYLGSFHIYGKVQNLRDGASPVLVRVRATVGIGHNDYLFETHQVNLDGYQGIGLDEIVHTNYNGGIATVWAVAPRQAGGNPADMDYCVTVDEAREYFYKDGKDMTGVVEELLIGVGGIALGSGQPLNDLKELNVDGSLISDFASGKTEFSMNVPNSKDSIDLSAMTVNPNLQLEIYNTTDGANKISQADTFLDIVSDASDRNFPDRGFTTAGLLIEANGIALTEGENTFEFRVTPRPGSPGTAKTYTLTVNRAAEAQKQQSFVGGNTQYGCDIKVEPGEHSGEVHIYGRVQNLRDGASPVLLRIRANNGVTHDDFLVETRRIDIPGYSGMGVDTVLHTHYSGAVTIHVVAPRQANYTNVQPSDPKYLITADEAREWFYYEGAYMSSDFIEELLTGVVCNLTGNGSPSNELKKLSVDGILLDKPEGDSSEYAITFDGDKETVDLSVLTENPNMQVEIYPTGSDSKFPQTESFTEPADGGDSNQFPASGFTEAVSFSAEAANVALSYGVNTFEVRVSPREGKSGEAKTFTLTVMRVYKGDMDLDGNLDAEDLVILKHNLFDGDEALDIRDLIALKKAILAKV